MIYDQIDLFSGIGGFALAVRWNGGHTRVFCEIEPFCQSVLGKRFPGVPIIGDIRELDGTQYRGSWLLTGGFPCQPFSCAGKRKGKEDDRYLWPEMCRVIREAQPEWVLAENVSGLLSQDGGMVFERVLSDLEDAGYETVPLLIPACAVNAPHRRDRVWFVAKSKHSGLNGQEVYLSERESRQAFSDTPWTDSHAHNPERPGCQRSAGGAQAESDRDRKDYGLFESSDCNDTYATIKGFPNRRSSQVGEYGRTEQELERCYGARITTEQFNEHWLQAATRLCRMDDGVSRRVDRLKALGNAIVPQVAFEIIRAMKEIS